MSVALDELVTPATPEECLNTLLTLAAALGVPTTSWQTGSPYLTLLTLVAQQMSNLTNMAVEITKGGFGELLPSDAWADLWAQSRFKETRVAATPATGYLTAVNASVTNYTLAAGELVVAHSTTGKTYRNTAPITIPASGTLSNFAIASDELGTQCNAAPSAITTLVSSLVGVTVSNSAAVLGTDKETTEALVDRCRAKLGSFSPNGANDAYNYVAKTPAYSATAVPITRTTTTLDAATGTVTTYLATAAGAPTGPDVAIVQSAFDTWAEPWGVNSIAAAATEVSQAVTYHVWVKGSQLTSVQIQTAIASAIAVFFSTLPIGGYVIPPDSGKLYVQALEQAIGQAVAGIWKVSVSIPASDLALATNEVAVLGTITPTVTVLT